MAKMETVFEVGQINSLINVRETIKGCTEDMVKTT